MSTRSTLSGLIRDPLLTFEQLGAHAANTVGRVDLGLFRPYLVTRPEHVAHVLRDNASNYRRDGMMWRPLRRFFGNGLGGEGAEWEPSRRLIQPLFSAKNIASQVDVMARTITDVVADLIRTPSRVDGDGRSTVDAEKAMGRIVHAALVRIFFGGRVSLDDADRLGAAVTTAFTSLTARMLLPFVPESVPLPGDRAFRRAVREADDILFPLVRRCRAELAQPGPPDRSSDIASLLCQSRDDTGEGLTDQRVRDDIVAMFGGGTETTAVMLTWLWVVLDTHPAIARRLYTEIATVVGDGPVRAAHLADLRFTTMVLQELLRLYPAGWIIPRAVVADDIIDGARISAGSTIILSPYLTHRLPDVWDQPLLFDPLRFEPDRAAHHHRFAYFPFSGGAHQCLGSHLFLIEAQLIVAALLSQCRPRLVGPVPRPRAAVSLRPEHRVHLVLDPAPVRS